MSFIKNKQGIGITAVLGIVTFVLALTTTLFAVTINQATLVKKSLENTELYTNNVYNLRTASSIIENDPTILDDELKLIALSELLNINIVQPVGKTYWQLTNDDLSMPLTSYIEYIPPGSGGYLEFDELISDATLFENLELGIYAIPQDLYILAASQFYNEFISTYNVAPEVTSSFADIMNHASINEGSFSTRIQYEAPLSGTFTINSSTTMPIGKVLVVNGNLTINANFNGIAIVNGNVNVTDKRNVDGAFYVNGTFAGLKREVYGNTRSTFIFADTFNTGDPLSSATSLYTFTNFLTFDSNKIYVGGLFTPIIDDALRNNSNVVFQHITTTLTLNDGVPLSLLILISGSGGNVGEGQLLSTYPRKE